MPKAAGFAKRVGPYLLLGAGALGVLDSIFGRQIQAWIASLPSSQQHLPFLAFLAVFVGGLGFAAYRYIKD
jgi:hypothetical protein